MLKKIMRKHCLLEQLFTEMLGIHLHQASEEACKLEHYLSDEVTLHFIKYISKSGLKKGEREGWRDRKKDLNLLDFKEGDVVEITMVEHHGFFFIG